MLPPWSGVANRPPGPALPAGLGGAAAGDAAGGVLVATLQGAGTDVGLVGGSLLIGSVINLLFFIVFNSGS